MLFFAYNFAQTSSHTISLNGVSNSTGRNETGTKAMRLRVAVYADSEQIAAKDLALFPYTREFGCSCETPLFRKS
jgi:hypothetical protein